MTEKIEKKESEPEHVHIPLYEKNSREEEAELALKRTKITPAISWTLIVMLALVIFSEPLIQISREVKRNPGNAPQVLEVFKLLPSFDRADKRGNPGFWRYWGAMASVGDIQDFEKGLEKSSDIGQSLLPNAQNLLTGTFKAGNEQAYVGVPGWLFYRPEVDYCTGKGFLDAESLKQRSRGGDSSTEAVQPDPRIAILDLRDKLKARGIELIVMPAPIKPVIQPDKLSARFSPDADAVQNPSYKQFVEEMRAKGVRIFDVTDDLIAKKRATKKPQFLETDTHWTPEAMELAASSMANYINNEKLLFQNTEWFGFNENVKVSNLGDIAEMLKLPKRQKIYNYQVVITHPVRRYIDEDLSIGGQNKDNNKSISRNYITLVNSEPWQPDKSSDVLVLGDSFFNIYSLEGMGWGKDAGFVEHLSYQLQHPLDKIVINAGGSFAARKELDNRMKRGQDPLAGKKLVIYEFAMRDLMMGDWKIYPMVDKKKKSETIKPIQPVIPVKPVDTVVKPEEKLFVIDEVVPASIESGAKNNIVIKYTVPVDGKINITVKDEKNNNIRRLSGKNEVKKAGTYTVEWNGMDRKKQPVKAGKYTIVLTPVNETATTMLPGEKEISVTAPKTSNPVTPVVKNPPPVSKDLVVSGTVKAISVSPKPGTVAYKDCVIAIDLSNVTVKSGVLEDKEILVFVWGMKDNNLTGASAYNVGQAVTLKLTPWDKVEGKYGGYNRIELNGDDIDALNLYWGEGR